MNQGHSIHCKPYHVYTKSASHINQFFFLQIFHKERKNTTTSSKLYINAAEAINSINFNRVILMKIKHMNSFSIHVNLIFIFANMFPYHHNDHSTRLSCGLL